MFDPWDYPEPPLYPADDEYDPELDDDYDPDIFGDDAAEGHLDYCKEDKQDD